MTAALHQYVLRLQVAVDNRVPMDVGEAAVQEGFRSWLKKLWFRPNALQQTKRFEALGILQFETNTTSDVDADIEEEKRRAAGEVATPQAA